MKMLPSLYLSPALGGIEGLPVFSKRKLPATADNRVLEANAQRLRLSQSLEALGDIRID